MVTVDTMNKDGKYEENLALRRWATFTKRRNFSINKNQVIVHYKVSEGLSKYYEYVVRRYKEFDNDHQNIQIKIMNMKRKKMMIKKLGLKKI